MELGPKGVVIYGRGLCPAAVRSGLKRISSNWKKGCTKMSTGWVNFSQNGNLSVCSVLEKWLFLPQAHVTLDVTMLLNLYIFKLNVVHSHKVCLGDRNYFSFREFWTNLIPSAKKYMFPFATSYHL